MESGTLGADPDHNSVNYLVCRKTRGGNCLLVPHTSYATGHDSHKFRKYVLEVLNFGSAVGHNYNCSK